MGEVAEMIINGECCALCMTTFLDFDEGEAELKTDSEGVVCNATIHEHGYPVVCSECWEEDCGYQKADETVSTI